MAKFMLVKKGSVTEIDKWRDSIFKEMRKHRLKATWTGERIMGDDLFGFVYYECPNKKLEKLMTEYHLIIDQTIKGIHFMKSI